MISIIFLIFYFYIKLNIPESPQIACLNVLITKSLALQEIKTYRLYTTPLYNIPKLIKLSHTDTHTHTHSTYMITQLLPLLGLQLQAAVGGLLQLVLDRALKLLEALLVAGAHFAHLLLLLLKD